MIAACEFFKSEAGQPALILLITSGLVILASLFLIRDVEV